MVVNMITLVATTTVALKAHQHAGTKSQSIRLYREYIGDQWTDLLEDVYTTFKTEWQYRIPQSEAQQGRLRSFCA